MIAVSRPQERMVLQENLNMPAGLLLLLKEHSDLVFRLKERSAQCHGEGRLGMPAGLCLRVNEPGILGPHHRSISPNRTECQPCQLRGSQKFQILHAKVPHKFEKLHAKLP